MSDVLSLAAMSAVALTEGLKFLYNQAGELLKARREWTPAVERYVEQRSRFYLEDEL